MDRHMNIKEVMSLRCKELRGMRLLAIRYRILMDPIFSQRLIKDIM